MRYLSRFLALNFAALLSSSYIYSENIKDKIVPVTPDTEKSIPLAIDTLNTNDKFKQIILYSDKTWGYLDLGKPVITSKDFYTEWNTKSIHAFRDLNIKDLDDNITLTLADSLHKYYPPLQGRVISGYKFRRNREHKGIDIPLKMNDTIKAAFDGVVRICLPTRLTGGYGNLIVIRHDSGLETYYGHLNKYIVEPGEFVKAGEVIGFGGSTGRSTGPHLHFECRYMGQAFDPQRLIDFKTGTLRDSTINLKKHYFSIYSHYGQTDEESKAASGRIIHKVRSGDTLGGIAYKYGTTVKKICSLNGFSSKKPIKINQRIIVR